MVDTVDGALEIPGLTRDEVFRITCDNYRQVLPWAEDYRVVINVEPHGPYTSDGESAAAIRSKVSGTVAPSHGRSPVRSSTRVVPRPN